MDNLQIILDCGFCLITKILVGILDYNSIFRLYKNTYYFTPIEGKYSHIPVSFTVFPRNWEKYIWMKFRIWITTFLRISSFHLVVFRHIHQRSRGARKWNSCQLRKGKSTPLLFLWSIKRDCVIDYLLQLHASVVYYNVFNKIFIHPDIDHSWFCLIDIEHESFGNIYIH